MAALFAPSPWVIGKWSWSYETLIADYTPLYKGVSVFGIKVNTGRVDIADVTTRKYGPRQRSTS